MGFCVCGADDFDAGWQRWDDHPARKQWDVVKDLGAGALSQVVLARHKTSGEMAALKVVFLESPAVVDDPEHLAILQRESDLLSMLEHPNLVELKDVVRSPRQLVLVLEWLRGGQVIDRLHELGLQYSEQQAAAVFAQVAEAVAHLHEYNVLHRDIKPENVMFAEPPGEVKQAPLTAAQLQAGCPLVPHRKMPTVKLVDLGMACLYDPLKPITGPLGSPGFVAPEIIHGAVHAPSMDVFSLGALLFIMLVGRKPFNIKESESLRYATMSLTDAPGLKDPRWLELSPDAKHLLMGMLAYDPARRMTIEQVLAHEWVVSRGGVLPRPLGQDVVFGAATVASVRRLRNLCGGVVAFNRAAAAAGAGRGGRGGGGGGGRGVPAKAASAGAGMADSARDVYLRRLKQSQRLDASRGGAMHRLATSLASNAYAKAHDAGGSIHPKDDVSVRRGAAGGSAAGSSREGSASGRRLGWGRRSSSPILGGSLHGAQADPSTSRRLRFGSLLLPGGLTKSPTSVMLSEMERASSREASRRGGGGGGGGGGGATLAPGGQQEAEGGLARRPSTLQLLSAAAKVYLEGSVHGSRRGGTAALGAALAGGGGGGSAGTQRQVADDRSARSGRQRQLAGLPDASTSSSASSSSGLAFPDSEARQRGLAAAAAVRPAAGPTPPRTGPSPAASRGASGSAGTPAGPRGATAAAPAGPLSVGSDSSQAASPRPAGSAEGGISPGRSGPAVPGLRPHRVVQRRSIDNPLAPAPPGASRTWAEMQAVLRQQTPRSSSSSRSREGTGSSSAPGTRVVRIKPLE